MEPNVWMIAGSLLFGAAWCFGSGYFVALAPFNYNKRLSLADRESTESEPPVSQWLPASPSRDEPKAQERPKPVAQALEPGFESLSLDDLMQEMARTYKAQEIAIFDGEGLLVQGGSFDPEIGIRVAGLSQGSRFGMQETAAHDSICYRDGDIGIHGFTSRTQPLWLVVRGTQHTPGERDLRQLGLACDRQWAWAA